MLFLPHCHLLMAHSLVQIYHPLTILSRVIEIPPAFPLVHILGDGLPVEPVQVTVHPQYHCKYANRLHYNCKRPLPIYKVFDEAVVLYRPSRIQHPPRTTIGKASDGRASTGETVSLLCHSKN